MSYNRKKKGGVDMNIILFNEISLNGKNLNKKDRETYLAINEMIPCDGVFMDAATAFNCLDHVDFETSEEAHKEKKAYDKNLPFLIIPDSKGILNGYLHMFRKREELRDVIILLAKDTPKEYIDYLNKKEYTYIVFEEENLDVYKALELIENTYNISTMRMEGSNRLHKLLFDKGLVKELYLLIDPIISNSKLNGFEENIPHLRLLEAKVLNEKMILTHYLVN